MTVVLGVHDVIAEDYPELVFPMRWRRWLWKAKARAAHGQADYVVTVSEYSKEGISRRFRCPDDRIWVVEEAPDPVFRPLSADEIDASLLARWGLSRESRFLAYLGGVNPHKNVPLLIEALAELRQDSRYQDVKLILIGDDRSDRFTPGLEMVEARIGALGLNHAVRFTGFLPDADVAQLLNVAKALVLPSFAEGFGLPAIEAAACATPVVATQNSPLPSLLEGGGIFIDPARKEMLTRALAVLVDNESERLRLGTRAREQAAKLTWERSARQLQALLQEVERRKR
jgi:glycosyltransferase involved in cell wall biosynthesis